jgi:hypothetical protein
MQLNINNHGNTMEGIRTFCELLLINLCSVGAFKLYAFVVSQPLIDNIYTLNEAMYNIEPFVKTFYVFTLAMLNLFIIYLKYKKAKKEN